MKISKQEELKFKDRVQNIQDDNTSLFGKSSSDVLPNNATLKRVLNHLNTERSHSIFDDRMKHYLVENVKKFDIKALIEELNDKGFNQSHYRPDLLQKAIYSFTGESVPDFRWNVSYQNARENARKAFILKQGTVSPLRPKTKDDVINSGIFSDLDTSAGFLKIETDGKVSSKRQYVEQLNDEAIRKLFENAQNRVGFPVIPGFRTQNKPKGELGSLEVGHAKSRLVSMIDVRQVLIEGVFARPIQDLIGKSHGYAGGKGSGEMAQTLGGHVSWNRELRVNWLSLDYSSFDQQIPSWLIYDAFEIVKDAFSMSEEEASIFDNVRTAFITKRFVDINGKMVKSVKGIPSGSYFTQIIGSICNYLIMNTYIQSKGSRTVQRTRHLTMGDDNITFTKFKLDIDDASSYIRNNFGMVIHPDKCSSGNLLETPRVDFLSRTWLPGTAWSEEVDPVRLFSKLLFPERFRDYYHAAERPMFDPKDIIFGLMYVYTKTVSEHFPNIGNSVPTMVWSLNELTRSKSMINALPGAVRYRLKYS